VVVARRDNDICHVAVGDRCYKGTPAGYLVDDSGTENNDSDSESDLE
jgi:hypothetical protein